MEREPGPSKGGRAGTAARTARLAVSVLLLTALLLAAAACADPCGNTVVDRQPSPDGRRDLVLFARDCGATTRVGTHLSLLAAGAEPRGAGNVFVADLLAGATAAPWGGPWAEARWLPGTAGPFPADESVVLLFDEPGSRVVKRAERVSGLPIGYEPRRYQP